MEEKKKTYHFISGLPRSGSTLLANILAQNPRFHTTATSGIADIMLMVRNQWDKLLEFQAHPNDDAKKRVLKGVFQAYFEDVEKPVVFDKSRAWVAFLELLEYSIGYKPKILVPVRDVRDILASFEKLWRKNASTRQIPQEAANYVDFQTVEGRCAVWMRGNEPVGIAYNRIKDAVVRGYTSQLYFVEFERLTRNPEDVMKEIYAFLGETYFKHDFNKVDQVTVENDTVYGIEGLHDIRNKVEPIEPQWSTILGHASDPYANLSFWKRLDGNGVSITS